MTIGDVGIVTAGHRSRSWLLAVASVIAGIPVGLLSTSLGLFYPWVIAVAAFILGAVVVVRRREFWFAALGVIAGTAGWWLLALMAMRAG